MSTDPSKIRLNSSQLSLNFH